MSDGPRAYRGTHVTVTFDKGVCIHAASCVRQLPSVFDVEARPWIQPDNASADEVVAQVARCPSGALQILPRDD